MSTRRRRSPWQEALHGSGSFHGLRRCRSGCHPPGPPQAHCTTMAERGRARMQDTPCRSFVAFGFTRGSPVQHVRVSAISAYPPYTERSLTNTGCALGRPYNGSGYLLSLAPSPEPFLPQRHCSVRPMLHDANKRDLAHQTRTGSAEIQSDCVDARQGGTVHSHSDSLGLYVLQYFYCEVFEQVLTTFTMVVLASSSMSRCAQTTLVLPVLLANHSAGHGSRCQTMIAKSMI